MKTLNTSDWTPRGTSSMTLRRHGLDPLPGARYPIYLASWREQPELYYQPETEAEHELLQMAQARGLLVELDFRPLRRASETGWAG